MARTETHRDTTIKWLGKILLVIGLTISLWLVPAKLNSLPPKSGYIENVTTYAQFTNVHYCGKTVSITVAHLTDVIAIIRPEIKPLAIDQRHDVAIYPVLSEDIDPVEFAPSGRTQKYLALSYIKWMQAYVLLRYTYSGVEPNDGTIVLQGPGWSGLSGAGFYNEYGEFVGSASTYVGFYGQIETLPAGLITITKHQHIKDLLDQQICKTL